MNKETLTKRVLSKNQIPRQQGFAVLDRIFELIKESIKKDKSFAVDYFGEFKIEHREMKSIIDYKKKSEVLLPPKDKLVFIPSKNLAKNLKEIHG